MCRGRYACVSLHFLSGAGTCALSLSTRNWARSTRTSSMTKWARVCFLVVGTRTAGPETSTLNLENGLRSFYFPSPTTKIHSKFTLKGCRAVLE